MRITDLANFLARHDMQEVAGELVMAAVLGHGDIVWRCASAKGSVLEIGIHQYVGRRCSNAWAALLKGQPLLEPVKPRSRRYEERDENLETTAL